ncbi:MAG: phosphate uptake regulator PhoU [Halobacteriaceae archaeon]
MTRERFQAALTELREAVRELGETVRAVLREGLDAIGASPGGAFPTAPATGVADRLRELEADCVELFALQQPVGGDLRHVAASYKVLTDLHRVATLGRNLGGYATAVSVEVRDHVDLGPIADLVDDQFETALDAYADDDVAAARRVHGRDDEVDALCARASQSLIRDLLERSADASPWAVEAALDDVTGVLLAVRDLERVGDHAANVAARTVYAVENDPSLLY